MRLMEWPSHDPLNFPYRRKTKGLSNLLDKTATKIKFTRTKIFSWMSITELQIVPSLY
jgi:hypothetical protein